MRLFKRLELKLTSSEATLSLLPNLLTSITFTLHQPHISADFIIRSLINIKLSRPERSQL